MKAKVYVAKQIHIPDAALPRLVELAKRERRRHKSPLSLREHPISVEEVVEQAVCVGLLKLDDYSWPVEDERVYYKGQWRDQIEVWKEQAQRKAKKK